MDTSVSLQVTDYIVLAFILLVSLGTGVLFAVKDFRNANRTEYLLGGRRMPMIPVALSIFATFTSGISLLGSPIEFYMYGEMSCLVYIGGALGCIYVMLLLVPLVYPLRLTSLYEYLQLRFESSVVRLLVVFLGMLQTLCYMAIALLSPALALQAGVGIPLWLSVGVAGLIVTMYTAIGGIKSVVWTDAFQCLVALGGVFIIIIKGFAVIGGGDSVMKIIRESGRASFAEFSLDPRVKYTWLGATFGISVFVFATICNQSSLQRISAMRSMRAAKQAFLITSILYIVFGVLIMAMSWVTFAYYVYIRCDPFQVGLVKNRNQLSPYFVMHALRDVPAVGGIYMAMIFSGSLSTVSSGINALAANTVEDILKKPLHNVRESTATLITKIIVFIYGILIIGLAYGANSIQGSIPQMFISGTGASGGVVLGIFLLGALIPWANKYGAICGGVISLVFTLWLTIGNQIYGSKSISLALPPTDMCFQNSSLGESAADIVSQSYPDNITLFESETNQSAILHSHVHMQPYLDGFSLYDISNVWFALISSTITLILGMAISYCTRKYCVSATDEKYLSTFVRKWRLSGTSDTKYENNEETNGMIHLNALETKHQTLI